MERERRPEDKTTFEAQDGDWIPVHNRRRLKKNTSGVLNTSTQRTTERKRPSVFDRLMRETTISYFFTRFPDSWDTKALWKTFERHGDIVDLYLANKRTKVGTRFGFAHFKNVINPVAFEKKLAESISGTHEWSLIHVNGRSFAQAVNGNGVDLGSSSGYSNAEMENSMVELVPNQILCERLKTCLLGKVKSFEILQNITSSLLADGLQDCVVHYIGGLSILLEWPTESAANDILDKSKNILQNWMEDVQKWDEEMEQPKRLAWIQLEGLPMHAWSVGSVESLTKSFGRIIEVDNINLNSFQVNNINVLLLMKSFDSINRVIKARLKNRVYQIKVTENTSKPIETEFNCATNTWTSENDMDNSNQLNCTSDDDFDISDANHVLASILAHISDGLVTNGLLNGPCEHELEKNDISSCGPSGVGNFPGLIKKRMARATSDANKS
ncbi:nucleotide-binding alpha-beta plait domain-containing protein, partial [Tanacetum coccineum]